MKSVLLLAPRKGVFPPKHKGIASLVDAPLPVKGAPVLLLELLALLFESSPAALYLGYLCGVAMVVATQVLINNTFAHVLALGAHPLSSRHQGPDLRICEVLG